MYNNVNIELAIHITTVQQCIQLYEKTFLCFYFYKRQVHRPSHSIVVVYREDVVDSREAQADQMAQCKLHQVINLE